MREPVRADRSIRWSRGQSEGEDSGSYVLDEPESALSFDSCLVLLTLMSDMCAAGSQIVLATHSPILAALPGANLLQLDFHGIRPIDYDETDLVTSWRSFLNSPRATNAPSPRHPLHAAAGARRCR